MSLGDFSVIQQFSSLIALQALWRLSALISGIYSQETEHVMFEANIYSNGVNVGEPFVDEPLFGTKIMLNRHLKKTTFLGGTIANKN